MENAIRLWSQPIIPAIKPKIAPPIINKPAPPKPAFHKPFRLNELPHSLSSPKTPILGEKPFINTGKVQNPKNVSDLRQALKVVLEKKENKVEEKKVNEVPEDVLKKTLGLDEKKWN